MNGLLDCTTCQSALGSLAGLLGVKTFDLQSKLSSLAIDWDSEESEETQLVRCLGFESAEELPLPEATRWFHAVSARVESRKSGQVSVLSRGRRVV